MDETQASNGLTEQNTPRVRETVGTHGIPIASRTDTELATSEARVVREQTREAVAWVRSALDQLRELWERPSVALSPPPGITPPPSALERRTASSE